MRTLFKIMAIAAGLLFISAMDASFFPGLGGYLSQMNFALALSLFLLVIVDEKIAFFVYIIAVLMTGFTSFSLIVLPLLLGGLTLVTVNWLFESFFTNRSYYSLIALGLIGWLIYYSSFALIIAGLKFLNFNLILPELSLSWMFGVLISALATVLLLTAGYIVMNNMSRRFKSYFVVYHR